LPIVFPTPVGVFLGNEFIEGIKIGLPHARGGVSTLVWGLELTEESSPRPWGCFHRPIGDRVIQSVFPTPVGVFPRAGLLTRTLGGLPHARGGVSSGYRD